MTKFIATYEFELDHGDIPAQAIAHYLLTEEENRGDWNSWEISQEMKILEIVPKDDRKSS